MTWFLYRLNPPRPDYAQTMTEDEMRVMGEHSVYWTGFLDRGTCVIFSPVADPAGVWGVAVVRARDAAEVEAIGAGDPAVTSGVCTFDVLPMLSPVTRLPDSD